MIKKLTLTGESVLNLPNYTTKNVKFWYFLVLNLLES